MFKHTPPMPEGMKWCHKCAQGKPRDAFTIERRKPDGLRSCCRECDAKTCQERKEIRRIVEEAYRRMAGA